MLDIVKVIKKFLKALLFYCYNHWVSFIPLYVVRKFYLSSILRIDIGRHTAIHMGCFFTGDKIKVGNNSVINRNCYLDGRGGLEIGNNVNVSPECYLLSLTHDLHAKDFHAKAKKTLIQDYCWLGARTLILPGIQISYGVVVGAGSVVTKSFDKNQIIAGVPAKVIGQREEDYNYRTEYFPFFDTDITAQ
jgi:maltose O-acetyltransferase